MAVGVLVLSLTIRGGYTDYVKLSLGIPLVISGLFLLVVGAVAHFGGARDDVKDDGHGHGSLASYIGLTLLLPVVIVFVVVPAPLGAYAAGRGDQNAAIAAIGDRDFPTILDENPGRPDMIDTTMSEFLPRAFDAPDLVNGIPVRIVGFSAPDEAFPDGYLLTRFAMSCCAADAFPLQFALVDPPSVPDTDSWVEVEMVWRGDFIGEDENRIPVMQVLDQRPTQEPDIPYEYMG